MQEAIELLQKWQEFKIEFPNGTKSEFGMWLHIQENKMHTLPQLASKINTGTKQNPFDNHPIHFESLIGILMGRMVKYFKYYCKPMFEEQYDIKLDEWTVLAGLYGMKSASKTDIIIGGIMEKSTGMEMIKRLVKRGFIKESKNPEDSRSTLISLTNKGEKLFHAIKPKLDLMGKFLCADLSENQKYEVYKTFSYLNDFHLKNYLEHSQEDIPKLMNNYK